MTIASAPSGTIRVWANETAGSQVDEYGRSAETTCKHCGLPITWMRTERNFKAVPLDGHGPAPLRTERDPETGRTIEIHDDATIHFGTCAKRAPRLF